VFWNSHVCLHPAPLPPPRPDHLELRTLVAHASQEGVVGERPLRVARDVDAVDLEGVEHVEKAADVVGIGAVEASGKDVDRLDLYRPYEG
jgi:hypothetical protein